MGSACRRLSGIGLACAAGLAVAAPGSAGPLGWGPHAPGGPLAPQAAPAQPANATADLRLVWVDVAGVARPAFAEARREILSLLRRAGVRATVREGDVHGTSDASELTVVVLPGPPSGGRLHGLVMGATQRTPEGVRAMWVYASAVRATLGLEARPGRFWPLPDRRRFGVALGRVVVHELVHAVVPRLPHEREGLMAERRGRPQLLQPALPLDPATADALRASLVETPIGDARRPVAQGREGLGQP